MPVQKQLVPVQFGGGINTKVDPKQLHAGQLLTLQNGQFSKQGQINKRYGYDILNTSIEGGGTITAGVELAAYKNELVLFDGTNIYSYLAATGNWSNRGVAISVITEDKDIIRRSDAQQLNPDMAFLNGVEVYAWEDSRGGIRYSVLDTVTKAFAVSDVQVNASGVQPKVIAFQNQIFIFYNDGVSTLFYQQVNPLNPTVLGAQVSILADGLTKLNGFPYDVHVTNNQMYVAYLSNDIPTGTINVFYLSATFAKSAVVTVNNSPTITCNTGFQGALNVSHTRDTNVWISWANGVSLYTASYDSLLLTNQVASTLVDTADVRVITGIDNPITNFNPNKKTPGPSLLLFYEVHASLGYNEQTRYVVVHPTGIPGLPGTLGAITTIRSVGLASKAWQFGNNTYINCSYQSTLQATDFTFYVGNVNAGPLTTPVIVAKETPSVGGGLQTNNMCPETVNLASGIYKFANLQAGKIISEANTVFTLFGVNTTKLTFTPSDNFINTVQENTLLIVGGILQGYDGVATTELGFNIYPENISYVAGSGTPGLSTGTYLYQVEFEWTDNYGQIYRSAPSTPTQVNVTFGQSVTIGGPSLRLTAKNKVSIVIYRSAANGTTLNRVTSTLAPLLNDPSTDTWTFVDILSDISASSNELIYTAGNILDNVAPPANSIIATYNDRVFLAGMSDKLLMWYSQTVVDNTNANTIPPQFSDSLTIGLDPRGGDITALGLLNQILIIFKANHIFSLQGNGPDATGANSDYGDPTLITSDVGCINANSVVIVPMGLMFQSAKGIYLLDQSQNLSYIGAPVEDFNSYNITSSVLSANANQVIFTTSQGIALVYDYYFQQWSTWTNHYAQDCVVYNNNFSFLTGTGQVFVQNQSKFTDGSTPIYLSWTLPNLSFAGLQGYQRVFRCFILGTYKGNHTLNVSVAYDFNDSYTQSVTVKPAPATFNWGSDLNWGTSQFWGGQGYQIYEFRIDFQVQKCTSIRLMVSDNQTSTYNEGYAISSVVFEVGALPGGNRLPATSQYGAK